MANLLKQRIIDSHDYHIYSCLWIHEKQLLKAEKSRMLPCAYSCDILYCVNWEGGKENFYCHNSIILGEKKMWCILSIYFYMTTQKETLQKKKKSDALSSLKRYIFWYVIQLTLWGNMTFFPSQRISETWEASINTCSSLRGSIKQEKRSLPCSGMSVHTKALCSSQGN